MKRIGTLLLSAVFAAMLTACGTSHAAEARPQPAPAPASKAAAAQSLKSVRIAIDPGHGGIDNGASGTDTNVHEDVLNLDIAKLLAKKFMAGGADVLMTRKSEEVDYSGAGGTMKRRDMDNRARLILAQSPQVLVSIHMNKYPSRSVCGAQAFFAKGSTEGEKLAQEIQASLNSTVNGSRKLTAKTGDYFMLKVTGSPSVIVECGFLSNHDDEKNLQNPAYRQKLADCIYSGICKYLGIE